MQFVFCSRLRISNILVYADDPHSRTSASTADGNRCRTHDGCSWGLVVGYHGTGIRRQVCPHLWCLNKWISLKNKGTIIWIFTRFPQIFQENVNKCNQRANVFICFIPHIDSYGGKLVREGSIYTGSLRKSRSASSETERESWKMLLMVGFLMNNILIKPLFKHTMFSRSILSCW